MGLTYLIKLVQQNRVAHSFINMSKILSTGNVRLFPNTFAHVQASIFFGHCHRVSSVCLIHFVLNFDTMKKFVGLTHLIKPIQQKRVVHSFINMSKILSTDNVWLFLNTINLSF